MAEKKKELVPVQIPANAPYLPPLCTQEEAHAIAAFMHGEADADQQGLVWGFIVGRCSELSSFPYYPGEADMRFAMGKRFVGHHLVRFGQMGQGEIVNLPKLSRGATAREDDEMPTT